MLRVNLLARWRHALVANFTAKGRANLWLVDRWRGNQLTRGGSYAKKSGLIVFIGIACCVLAGSSHLLADCQAGGASQCEGVWPECDGSVLSFECLHQSR